MSAGCVRWVLSRTVRAVCSGSPGYWTPASRFNICSERSNTIISFWRWSQFSTTVVNNEKETPAPKKKKPDPQACVTITSAGRNIPHPDIEVLSDTGESLGTMHRLVAIKLMESKGLKLALVSEHKNPPVYQLMSGKQIYEEQLKQREKEKPKPDTLQIKELTISPAIAAHDLSIKLKQVESWLEKKYHVRITLRSRFVDTAVKLDTTLEQMVKQMGMAVGFASPPRVKQDGKVAMCVLRLPSVKELAKLKRDAAAASQSASSSPKATQKPTVTAEESTER
ncbi:translation initiation factor IF-3, mitochondrial [Dicentrarchus labrax]|uniref:Translation initiation factor 3 N-terminal domain-containing protein n=1 Tax=Dicentrarchus labrax TaxID=13489 RepID=A0A8P4K4V0_DICLA|nr:translation initiation factor IF-3, mitochondrial [Dicentrarchus labrax]